MARDTPSPPHTFEDALDPAGRTLRSWLLLAVLGALGLLLALAGWLVWNQYENAKRQAAEDLRQRAVLAATVLDTYFTGQLAALSAIAASPAVVGGDSEAMTEYFARFPPGTEATFSAGVGWIDLEGRQRATSDPRGPSDLNLAERSYFREALETKKPFVAEAIVARTTKRRIIVMSVPTRDRRGRLSGVLAGGIVIQPSSDDSRASELGFEGLEFLDREGQQLLRRDLAPPQNRALAARLAGGEGVLVDTRGLDGSPRRVVAYASSRVPEWTAVLDQPVAVAFADARRSLFLESSLLGGAAILMVALVLWTLRRVRRDLDAGRTRVRRWADLTRALNEASDVGDLTDVLASTLAAEFPRTSALVRVAGADPDAPPTVSVERGVRSAIGDLDGSRVLDAADLLGRSPRFRALESAREVTAHVSPADSPRRVRSLYCAPLFEDDEKTAGVAVVLSNAERALSADDQRLLRAFADQTSQGIARVRRHQQEHDVAVLLQKSLLPAELPASEGLRLSAHYRAGVANTNVGGDWYDAVQRPDALVHFTVGDVAGRGIEAAVAMARLRHAFRAHALEHRSPGAIVERMARQVAEDGMATMVCVTFDQLTGELTYASAGHPPPLLVDLAERSVTRLESAGAGPPLGWRQAASSEDGRTSVRKGLLALYTDGLVERRSSPLDEGIARLEEAILDSVTLGRRGAAPIVDRLMDAGHDDDVALMLVELEAAPKSVRLEIDADASLLAGLRRRVRAWLDARGLGESDRDAIVLALSEACSNAIEHAYRERPGPVGIALEDRSGTIRVRVSDNGTWRAPDEDTTRGRGLQLMRGLMDSAEVTATGRGTDVILELSPTG